MAPQRGQYPLGRAPGNASDDIVFVKFSALGFTPCVGVPSLSRNDCVGKRSCADPLVVIAKPRLFVEHLTRRFWRAGAIDTRLGTGFAPTPMQP